MIKKIKYIIIFKIFFLLSTSHAYSSENKILFIDVEYIYLNSIAGKEINKKIQLDAKKINDELKISN